MLDKFKIKVDQLASSVSDSAVKEFYGTLDIKTELRVYLALCYLKEINPIKEDANFFK